MSILQGLDPQAIEEVFGDVPNLPAGFDVEYLPVTRANVEHMAVIIQLLQEDAAKMRAELAVLTEERDAAKAEATQQSEYIQSHGLTEFEMARLRARIAELERERDTMGAVLAAQSRNAVINGGTPTLTERAQTKRIAELEAERDALQKNLSSTEAFYAASKERAEQAEKERDAAIADARKLAQNWNGVMTSVELEAIVKKYLNK